MRHGAPPYQGAQGGTTSQWLACTSFFGAAIVPAQVSGFLGEAFASDGSHNVLGEASRRRTTAPRRHDTLAFGPQGTFEAAR